ncbi:hypothetical protein GCM10023324_38040 [Streptomyces youssoufiensis]
METKPFAGAVGRGHRRRACVGAATARALAYRGARVALLGREEATLAAVAEPLPGDARCREVDVTDDDAMARVA